MTTCTPQMDENVKTDFKLEDCVEIDGIQWERTWSKLTTVEYTLKKLKHGKRLIPEH